MQITRADDLALLDENHGIASDFHFTEKMGIEEDGGPALAFATNDVADEVAAHGIQPGSGLIEKHEFRLVNEGLGEADTLHHPFGKAAQAPVAMRSKTHELEIGGNALTELSGRQAAKPPVQCEKFGGGQPVVKAKIFGEEADLAPHFDVMERAAKNLRVTARGFDETKEHFDGSAFTSPVGPEESEDFASTHLEREAADRDLGAELLAQANSFDGQVVCGRQRLLRGFRCAGCDNGTARIFTAAN